MAFRLGDSVHVATLGKGIVREVRNGGHYVVELKGRSIVVAGDRITVVATVRPRRTKTLTPAAEPLLDDDKRGGRTTRSLDLHGKTVDEAIEMLDGFLNSAILDGDVEGRIIHGRSGGRIRAAVHARLTSIPTVRAYRLDPRNPGVTIVIF